MSQLYGLHSVREKMVWSGGRSFMTMCIIFMMCPRRIRPSLPIHESLHNDEMTESSPNAIHNAEDAEWVKLENKTGGPTEDVLDLSEADLKKFKIWPHGIIPYFIDDFSFDKVLRDRIRKTIDGYNTLTGIQFIELPLPPDEDSTRWVFFINRMGQLECIDYPTINLTNQGIQKIVLGYDCFQDTGSMAALFLSLIGIPPQHNAPNRDDYIEISNENILHDKRHLFQKLAETDWLFGDHPYDFASASHYDFHAYTANGLATIRPKEAIDEPVGEAKQLSKLDIRKIKTLYSSQINKKSALKADQCSKLYKPANPRGKACNLKEPKKQPKIKRLTQAFRS